MAGDLGRGEAAPRLHDLQRRRTAGGGERRLHAGEIVVDHGLDVGVEAGGGGALVFAKGGVDLGRERDRDAGQGGADGLRHGLLVRRVLEREQQADGDRLDPRGLQRGDGGIDRGRVERGDHRAIRGDALSHLGAARAGGQPAGRLGFQRKVVKLVAHLAADLQRVAKTLGGDKADARTLPLEHGIGRDRRPVREAGDRRRRDAVLVVQPAQRLGGGEAAVLRGRRQLHGQHAVRAGADDIGEGAADVDADAVAGGCARHPPLGHVSPSGHRRPVHPRVYDSPAGCPRRSSLRVARRAGHSRRRRRCGWSGRRPCFSVDLRLGRQLDHLVAAPDLELGAARHRRRRTGPRARSACGPSSRRSSRRRSAPRSCGKGRARRAAGRRRPSPAPGRSLTMRKWAKSMSVASTGVFVQFDSAEFDAVAAVDPRRGAEAAAIDLEIDAVAPASRGARAPASASCRCRWRSPCRARPGPAPA